jgi:hypothetical protein
MQKDCAEVACLGEWLPNAEGLCRSLPVWVSSNETFLKLLSWRSWRASSDLELLDQNSWLESCRVFILTFL